MNTAVVEDPESPGVFLAPSGRHSFALWTVGAAFLVLFAGGMVTSTGSSLAVPDWPLAYGQYFPRMTGGVLFEHGHRLLAGLAAVLVWVLAAWTHVEERRPWVRSITAAAALGIVAQAVLGGATVLWGLPPEVSIAHACLGQGLFALVVAAAQASSPWFVIRRAAAGRLWQPAALAVGTLLVQLVLGAAMRHTGKALAWHLAGAVLAFWTVTRAALAGVRSERPSLIVLSNGLMLLALAQVFLGFGALAARHLRAITLLALLPTAHQATGALLLAASTALALRAGREEAA